MYTRSNFVYVLPMKIWKNHPQKYDTMYMDHHYTAVDTTYSKIAKKMSVTPWRPNLAKNEKVQVWELKLSRTYSISSSRTSGAEFLVLFDQKRGLSENIIIWVKTLSFWTNKVVIWWLFNDDFRAREREREEKRTRNSVPYLQYYFHNSVHW